MRRPVWLGLWLGALLLLSGHLVSPGVSRLARPSLDLMVQPSLLISPFQVHPDRVRSWGLAGQDQVVTLDGIPLRTASEIPWIVAQHGGASPSALLQLFDGRRSKRIAIPVAPLDAPSLALMVAPFALYGWIFSILAIAMLALRPGLAAARTLASACGLGGLLLLLYIDLNELGALATFLPLLFPLTGAEFVRLGLVFPTPPTWFERRRIWSWALRGGAMALTAAMAWQTTRLAGATDPALRHHLAIALRTEGNLAIVIGFLSVILGIAARLVFAPRHSLVRMQTQIAATGSAIALLPFVIWFATSPRPAIPLSLAIYCLGLFPLAFAYAIVRAQLFDIRLVLRNSVLYVTLSLGLGAVYTLVAIALRWLGTGMTMDRADLASQLLATLIVVALSVSLRDRLQALIDRRLFRAQYDAQAAIETTSQSLATLLDPEEIARRVVGTVAETMAVETASCLLERDGRYWPMASHGDATYPVIEADTVWRRSFQGAPRSSRGSTCGSSAPTGSRIVCTWSRPRWSCRSPSNTA